ncbi:MAG TPA: sulfotransferase [Acidimicrobiales bacterium]
MSGDDSGHGQRVNGSNGSNGRSADGARPNRPSLDAFPFVVGCRRSGTTLVRAMLHSHPLLAVPPESRFLVALAPDLNRPWDPAHLVEELLEHDGFARWGLRRPVLRASFRDDPPRTYADAMRRLYTLWAAAHDKPRVADKTPDHVLRIGAITALFPDARVVHVVRDGRDVAASFLELGWVDSIEKAALHWRHRVLTGRQAGALLPSSRYHELRYEDLVERPEPTLKGMCAALDLEFDPAMLRYEKAARTLLRSEAHPHHNRYVTRPLRRGLRDWRRDLPAAAVARFEALAGDALAALGYELRSRTHKPGLRPLLATRPDWLAWHTRKLRRSGREALKGEL